MTEDYKPPQPSFLMANVVFPIYDTVVLYYPKWWTPNGITLFGITCTILASIIGLTSIPANHVFDPAQIQLLPVPHRDDIPVGGVLATFADSAIPFITSNPSIILAIVGFLNLVYCVADNTDGRQARRLKMSSAIGEYLDHGLDCVTSLMSTFILIVCVGMSANVAAAGVALIASVTMLSHLLNLEHGIMIWGNAAASVDEAMLAFAFGPLIPTLLPALTTYKVPFFVEMKVLDLAWLFFIGSQVHVAFSILSRKKDIVVRAPFLFLMATIFIFSSAVAKHNEATESAAEALAKQASYCPISFWLCNVDIVFGWLKMLSFPAVWTVAFACTASILCHMPIVGKCTKATRMEPWPLAFVLLIWMAFVANPVAGAWVAVWSHTIQVLINIYIIKKAAAKK